MTQRFDRNVRVANLLREEISLIISREMKDPNLKMVTVTHVKVSRDLKRAHVYFSVYGTSEEIERTVDVLNRAEGFLRGELGRNLRLKTIPHLTFEYDDTYEKGMKIEGLLRKIRENGNDE